MEIAGENDWIFCTG